MPDEPAAYYDRPSAFPWPPVLWFGAMALAWAAQQVWPVAWPGVDDRAAHTVGWGLGIGGLGLFIWAFMTLRAAGTTILPDKGSDVLVTAGPFRRLRNPIYLAQVMILLWLAEVSKNPWFLLFAVVHGILLTALAIIPEERHLEARFGDAYADYKARSRRWI